jgi:tetratricopeptide (TPR) repeat protein
MCSHRIDRCLVIVTAAAFGALVVHPALAQRAAGPASAPTSSPGSIGNSSRGTFGSVPNSGTSTTTTGTYDTRPLFLSGKVMFDDGTSPNSDIRIERVCSGNPRLESHTDSKGRFSFQMDHDATMDTDAADASVGGWGPNGQTSSVSGNPAGVGGNRTRADRYWNCELRAAYPGYRSDVVELGTRTSLDDPNVGTIVLHRLGNVQGSTISLTTALAPKHAQKEYEKGIQSAEKGKFEEAEKHLSQATEVYPKYAIAWFALGQVQQRTGKAEEARKSYQAAIAADNKYVSPYDQLALLSAQQAKWQDAADLSKQAIGLNPVEFPSSFWYNALANYNLKKTDAAAKSAGELVKLDTTHKFPQVENLLAQISLEKGNYPDAAAHLRTYLTLVPNAQNADALKQTLLKIEQASAAKKQ